MTVKPPRAFPPMPGPGFPFPSPAVPSSRIGAGTPVSAGSPFDSSSSSDLSVWLSSLYFIFSRQCAAREF